MKKIINGKKYDTATATELGYFNNGHYPSDFHYLEETLLRKRNGEFFVYGEGGAGSIYAVQCEGRCHRGGCDIRPLSDAEAREWVELHLTGDDYEDIFGPVEE